LKKHLTVSQGLGELPIQFNRREFANEFDVNIILEYDTKTESRKMKEDAVFMALFPTLKEFGDEFGIRYLLRKKMLDA
jgi:hypothetical protein